MEESRLKNIEEAITSLSQQMNQRFDQVDWRFEKVDQRFEKVDQRFDQIDQRFETVDQRFEQNAVDHTEFREAIEEARKDREEQWNFLVKEFNGFDQRQRERDRHIGILIEKDEADRQLFRETIKEIRQEVKGELRDHDRRITRLEQSA